MIQVRSGSTVALTTLQPAANDPMHRSQRSLLSDRERESPRSGTGRKSSRCFLLFSVVCGWLEHAKRVFETGSKQRLHLKLACTHACSDAQQAGLAYSTQLHAQHWVLTNSQAAGRARPRRLEQRRWLRRRRHQRRCARLGRSSGGGAVGIGCRQRLQEPRAAHGWVRLHCNARNCLWYASCNGEHVFAALLSAPAAENAPLHTTVLAATAQRCAWLRRWSGAARLRQSPRGQMPATAATARRR